MSSTNTPVTQADVDEWARDIGAHSDNANGPVYYYVSKAKWAQVHDMLGRLLVERDELRDERDTLKEESDDAGSAIGRWKPVANNLPAMVHDLVNENASLRERAEKAEAELADVCAVLDTAELWGWCSDTATPTTGVTMLLDASLAWQERAEKAEAAQADERGARAVDLARLSKAEASNGVAMLRRLVDFIGSRDGAESLGWQERLLIKDRIDRMIAEAEKHAEPPKDREGDGQPDWVWKSSKTARQCVETALELADAPSLDDDQLDAVAALLDGPRPKDREGDDVLGKKHGLLTPSILAEESQQAGGRAHGAGIEDRTIPGKDREGDDVLRACREEIRRRCEDAGDKPFPPHYWFDAALDELLRRALGEEDAS